MAIITLPFYAIILRPFHNQSVAKEGYQFLLRYIDPHRNFDGEIMVFGAMSGMDQANTLEGLRAYGYKGDPADDDCDFVEAEMHSLYQPVSWLETVDVKFFDEAFGSAQAWKMVNSDVYDLVDFHGGARLPRKGYQCDWTPYIAKIGG